MRPVPVSPRPHGGPRSPWGTPRCSPRPGAGAQFSRVAVVPGPIPVCVPRPVPVPPFPLARSRCPRHAPGAAAAPHLPGNAPAGRGGSDVTSVRPFRARSRCLGVAGLERRDRAWPGPPLSRR